jgi:hypothetical protein
MALRAWIVLIGVLQEFQILGMNFSTQLLPVRRKYTF